MVKRDKNMFFGVMGVLLAFSMSVNAQGETPKLDEDILEVVVRAERSVEQARESIRLANGQGAEISISEESPYLDVVVAAVQQGATSWKQALACMKQVEQCQEVMINSSEINTKMEFYVEASARAAMAHINVVKVSLLYVEALYNGKAESVDSLKESLDDVLVVSRRMQNVCREARKIVSE